MVPSRIAGSQRRLNLGGVGGSKPFVSVAQIRSNLTNEDTFGGRRNESARILDTRLIRKGMSGT